VFVRERARRYLGGGPTQKNRFQGDLGPQQGPGRSPTHELRKGGDRPILERGKKKVKQFLLLGKGFAKTPNYVLA